MKLGGEIAAYCTGIGISLALASTMGMDALRNAEAAGHARACIYVPDVEACNDVSSNSQEVLDGATSNEYVDMAMTGGGVVLGIIAFL